MTDWSTVAGKLVDLADNPKKLGLLTISVVVLAVVLISGFVVFEHYQPKKTDTTTVQQVNKGDRNQGAGTNNGQMDQVNH